MKVQDFSPLLRSVMARHGFTTVSEDTLDAFLAASPLSVIFLSGDWERLAESNDVAAVLPELQKLAPGLAVAVAERGAERALQLRFRFNKFPALVFMRGTGYLGAILGMRGWSEYGAEIAEILSRAASEPPPFKFPEACAPKTRDVLDSLHIH
ncbi:hydrogenase-1 expression HyaE [Aestuariivirga litoralis]|uniref:Hydrogenase-1 expression HyaE n=1 Tax=Aestuariivirga litoralis TaxID=2650924 RepID=A0A2W2BSN3_9HYPH|nr:hydrogenase-1 expression HyaE [Aestuariivirga litoralis]PZF76456.1 hydrogenase-1 expression HyaE [Aestuariivirga litoralis]